MSSDSVYARQVVEKYSAVTAPKDPTKGYDQFVGWRTSDGTAYVFGTAVTEDITLIAAWNAHEHKAEDPNKWESDETYHWQVCSRCKAIINKVEHNGGTANCHSKATCIVCGKQYGDLLAHSFTEKVEEQYLKSAATCTEKAVYYKSCSVCGEKGTETFEDGNALGHDWGEWTSNGDGTHTRVCKTDENHKETVSCSGGTATCKEKAKCAVCGQAYGELGAHSFTEKVAEKYLRSPATCTAKAVYYKSCAVCGEKGTETFETGNILGHDWGEWTSNGDGTHTRTCKTDKSHTETKDCHGGTATCTEKATCTDCGKAYGEKDSANHTGKKEWTTTKTTHEQKWSCCGEVTVAKESHTFGKWVITKKATSRKDGEKTRTCEVCEYVEKATIQATGAPAKTGDESHIGMWAGILCVSLAGIIALVVLYKKKHKK